MGILEYLIENIHVKFLFTLKHVDRFRGNVISFHESRISKEDLLKLVREYEDNNEFIIIRSFYQFL